MGIIESDRTFDEYSKLYEKARSLEKCNEINNALDIYLTILDKYEPIGTSYYERPAILLEKYKMYDKALSICNIVLNNPQRFNELTLKSIEENFNKRKNRLLNKINKSNEVVKKKISTNTEVISINKSISKEILYPDWYISISFGISKSESFVQALTLAKLAPQFIENTIEGKVLYQAIYSDSRSEYLQFIKLYELISKWKSCFVIINGNLIDRKIVGGINYCYGDNCRSGNINFCYGASEMTSNPFGCHRLQISAANNPWWTFSTKTNKGYIIDKKALTERIIAKSLPYSCCPNFNLNKILLVLSNLPDNITYKEYENLARDNYSFGEESLTLGNYSRVAENKSNSSDNNSTTLLKKIFKLFTK